MVGEESMKLLDMVLGCDITADMPYVVQHVNQKMVQSSLSPTNKMVDGEWQFPAAANVEVLYKAVALADDWNKVIVTFGEVQIERKRQLCQLILDAGVAVEASKWEWVVQDVDGRLYGSEEIPTLSTGYFAGWMFECNNAAISSPLPRLLGCQHTVIPGRAAIHLQRRRYWIEEGVGTWLHAQEWAWIEGMYGDRVAKRSQVPLINHIKEGVEVLRVIGASDHAIGAFIVHPLFQSDDVFFENKEKLKLLPFETMINVLEYRRAANTYLCREHTDAWTLEQVKVQVGAMSDDVRHMLIADKWQNRKDFRLYHLGTHARSDQLARYFDLWLELLCDQKLVEMIEREVNL